MAKGLQQQVIQVDLPAMPAIGVPWQVTVPHNLIGTDGIQRVKPTRWVVLALEVTNPDGLGGTVRSAVPNGSAVVSSMTTTTITVRLPDRVNPPDPLDPISARAWIYISAEQDLIGSTFAGTFAGVFPGSPPPMPCCVGAGGGGGGIGLPKDWAFVAPSAPGAADDGDNQTPFVTIQAAIDYFGPVTSAAEYLRDCHVWIENGTYLENPTMPHRALTLHGWGVIIAGTIQRYISDEEEHGVSSSVWRGCLTLDGGTGVDARDTHQTNRQGIVVQGGYRCDITPLGTGFTTHDLYLRGCKIEGQGIIIDPNTGNEVTYFEGATIDARNAIAAPSMYVQRCYRSKFGGSSSPFSNISWGWMGEFRDCDFYGGGGTITVNQGILPGMGGISDVRFFGPISMNMLPINQIAELDTFTNYQWEQNLTQIGAAVRVALQWSDSQFGEMYQEDNAVPTPINVIDQWEQVRNFVSGVVKGVSFGGAGQLTVNRAGWWELTYSISARMDGTGSLVEHAIAVNAAIQGKTKTVRQYPATDTGVVAGTGILALAASDVVDLFVRNRSNTTDWIAVHANVNLRWIGNP